MDTQPYILKKQITALITLCFAIIFSLIKHLDYITLTGLIMYFFVVLCCTFVPVIFKWMRYPFWIHSILFRIPFWFSIFWIPKNTALPPLKYLIILFVSLLCIGILLLIGSKQYITNITNLRNHVPISFLQYSLGIINLIYAIVSEEICFRGFYVGYVQLRYGMISVFISSILFSYIHYLNRWASVKYSFKIYILQFLLGIVLGTAYYLSHSIILVTLGHLVFDSAEVVLLTKQFFRKRVSDTSIFNDYE